MENNVVTLETAKKLKAVGFPIKTAYFYGRRDQLVSRSTLEYNLVQGTKYADDSITAAPTAQEIADQLPDNYQGCNLIIGKKSAMYVAHADTMAEALAALWLKLHPGERR